MQLNSSPKAGGALAGNKSNIVDAMEDDLVKKYENEKKEKDRMDKEGGGTSNFMIFERHFEDKTEEGEQQVVDSTKVNLPLTSNGTVANTVVDEEIKKEDLSSSSSINQPVSETCSIDAEPFQFLDSPKVNP